MDLLNLKAFSGADLQHCQQILQMAEVAGIHDLQILRGQINDQLTAIRAEQRKVHPLDGKRPGRLVKKRPVFLDQPCPSCGKTQLRLIHCSGEPETVCSACRWSMYGVLE